jgi:hypothetical protein
METFAIADGVFMSASVRPSDGVWVSAALLLLDEEPNFDKPAIDLPSMLVVLQLIFRHGSNETGDATDGLSILGSKRGGNESHQCRHQAMGNRGSAIGVQRNWLERVGQHVCERVRLGDQTNAILSILAHGTGQFPRGQLVQPLLESIDASQCGKWLVR